MAWDGAGDLKQTIAIVSLFADVVAVQCLQLAVLMHETFDIILKREINCFGQTITHLCSSVHNSGG